MSEDDKKYADLMKKRHAEWEAKCMRCGACCGIIEGDPCEHLYQADDGLYACSIYKDRFGLHKTVSGKPFMCVPIRNILHTAWPGDQCCGYKSTSQTI